MPQRRRGRLVALEGIDGGGKSTLAKGLLRRARRTGVSLALRREPADPTLGRLAQEAGARDAWTGAIYFTLDRFLARAALEADLARHRLVVTDRSFYSTLAYQGSALGAKGVQRIEELSRRVTIVPDRVILLDLPPELALRRLGQRGEGRGPLERRRTLTRVARRYREMARRGRWWVLDARRPPAELVDEVWTHLTAGGTGSARRRSSAPAEERT